MGWFLWRGVSRSGLVYREIVKVGYLEQCFIQDEVGIEVLI